MHLIQCITEGKLCVSLSSKGKHEDITREYSEAKTRYESIMDSLKNLKRYSKVRSTRLALILNYLSLAKIISSYCSPF